MNSYRQIAWLFVSSFSIAEINTYMNSFNAIRREKKWKIFTFINSLIKTDMNSVQLCAVNYRTVIMFIMIERKQCIAASDLVSVLFPRIDGERCFLFVKTKHAFAQVRAIPRMRSKTSVTSENQPNAIGLTKKKNYEQKNAMLTFQK